MNLNQLSNHIHVSDDIELHVRGYQDASRTLELIDSCRPYLTQFLPWVSTTSSVDDCTTFIQHCLDKYTNRQGATYGIYWQGQLVGICGYNSLSKSNHHCEIEYWLAEQYQGNGIMTQCVQALVDHFWSLGGHRVVLKISTHNTSSQALAQRIGCVHEGTLRHAELNDGVWHDLDVYALVNENN